MESPQPFIEGATARPPTRQGQDEASPCLSWPVACGGLKSYVLLPPRFHSPARESRVDSRCRRGGQLVGSSCAPRPKTKSAGAREVSPGIDVVPRANQVEADWNRPSSHVALEGIVSELRRNPPSSLGRQDGRPAHR
jgi:hypothetical protein